MVQIIRNRSKIGWLLTLSILGIIDSYYLTLEHYGKIIIPCTTYAFIDCGQVLTSKYAYVFGVPLAVIGLFHYSLLSLFLVSMLVNERRLIKYLILIQSTIGFFASIYFVYLQIIVIGRICVYCMGSALISLIIFFLVQRLFSEERKRLFVLKTAFVYKYFLRPILFLIEAEKIHDFTISFGASISRYKFTKKALDYAYRGKDSSLKQKISGIEFQNPIGLAAGFDYEANLTQLLPSLDFGFETVGTITNMAYQGNPPPRLGRLPKSKSLLVNKGFKSTGAEAVIKRIENLSFDYPVGISIGRTNSLKLKTQKQSVKDIVSAFGKFERSKVKHSYYELNISCPNLRGDITFYPPKNLKELVDEVDKLEIKKPIFVKMPIIKSDKETLKMLEVIARSSMSGIIFGNLQNDRKHSSFDEEEIEKISGLKGNFGGKSTYERSNELIKLAYKHYRDRFVIIGCGGVFSATDAYEKFALGASLVQLITGLVFQGPQLVSRINFELADILAAKGFKNISEAVGTKSS